MRDPPAHDNAAGLSHVSRTRRLLRIGACPDVGSPTLKGKKRYRVSGSGCPWSGAGVKLTAVLQLVPAFQDSLPGAATIGGTAAGQESLDLQLEAIDGLRLSRAGRGHRLVAPGCVGLVVAVKPTCSTAVRSSWRWQTRHRHCWWSGPRSGAWSRRARRGSGCANRCCPSCWPRWCS